MGLYLLIADDTTAYTSQRDWEPELPSYMDDANVLWLAFVNPYTMPDLPPAMARLAGKVTGKPVIAALGGQLYSKQQPKAWPWLASVKAAEEMAEAVAEWAKLGIDGIDLDIETGAGDRAEAGPNMMAFIRKLQQLVPGFIVTQPVYGYPGVDAENYVVNQGFKIDASAVVSSIGIMYYSGALSLNYVDHYTKATSQVTGFPITVDVPSKNVIVGADGLVSSGDLTKLATAVKDQNLGGIMVWYASVMDGATGGTAIAYRGDGDASKRSDQSEWGRALSIMQGGTNITVV
jgi:hypothetical protein